MKSAYLKTWVQMLAGLVVSGTLLFILAEGVRKSAGDFRLNDLLSVAQAIPLWALAVALGCQLMQGMLRAVRYRYLLRWEQGVPVQGSGFRLLAITFARNMFVDMLPSRLGELVYVWLVKRILGARIANGLTSLGAAFVFDLVALVLLILTVLGFASLGVASQLPPFAWVLFLVLGVACGAWSVFGLFPWAMVQTESWRRDRFRSGWIGSLHSLLEQVRECIDGIRQSGKLLHITLLSLLIRSFKYGGIVTLLLVILDRSFAPVGLDQIGGMLLGVVAGEAAASLPLPTFMSFGSYEAGGAVTLVGLGFTLQAAAISMFIVHLFSQVVDYSLGACALLIAWLAGWLQSPATQPALQTPRVRAGIALLFVVVLAVVAAGVLVYELKKARNDAPEPALSVLPESHPADSHSDAAVIQTASIAGDPISDTDSKLPQEGFAVWTSNRFGNHEVLKFDFATGALERLTETPGKEYYVSISPDGQSLLYAYAARADHSFRHLTGWSVVLYDLESGESRELAPHGFHPSWAGSSHQVVYSRGGNEIVLHDLQSDTTETLLQAGSRGVPSGFQFLTPSWDPQSETLAVTIRGSRRTKMLYFPRQDRAPVELPEGCQLLWIPGRSQLVYTADGRVGDNAFIRIQPDGRNAEVLLDLDSAFHHLYFPRFSANGTWMIYAASEGGHEHDLADYEVFVWKVGSATDDIQRLTNHPGNDSWPDLFVPQGR